MSGPAKWILRVILALLLLALLAVEFFFQFAHRRRPQRADGLERTGSQWRAYLAEMRESAAWFERQGAETVAIASFDGLNLVGRYLPAKEPRACVLLFHGYRSTGLRDFAPLIPFYYQNGLSTLLEDQRACGKSEGTYITFGVRERQDALAWARYMDRRLGGQVPLVLEGISLGGATVMMAADLPLPASVAGIISDCGFTSPWDIIAHCGRRWFHLPPFPLVSLVSLMSRLRTGAGYRDCSTLDTLAHSTLPLLLIHGGKDDFVPTCMTEQNYQAAAGWKRKVIVPEAGHGLSYLLERDRCQQELLAFMDHILGEVGHGQ